MQAEQEQKKLTPKQIPAAHPPSTKSRPANQSSEESVTAKGGRQPAPPPCTSPKTRPSNQSQAKTLPAEGGCDPALPRSPPARPTNDSTHPRPNPPRAIINKKKSKTPEIMKQWLERASPLHNTNRENSGLTGTGGRHPPSPPRACGWNNNTYKKENAERKYCGETI